MKVWDSSNSENLGTGDGGDALYLGVEDPFAGGTFEADNTAIWRQRLRSGKWFSLCSGSLESRTERAGHKPGR